MLENPSQDVLAQMIADAQALATDGITRTAGLHTVGLEQGAKWRRMFPEPDQDIDLALIEKEILRTCLAACAAHPAGRAFVLECTDLPPFSASIRQQTGLPVFDFITMTNHLQASL